MEQNGVECRIIKDDIVMGFPERSQWIPNKFNDVIKEFKPDAVLVDRFSHFALAALDAGIQLLIQLREDHWQEVDISMKKDKRSVLRKLALWYKNRMVERYLRESRAIFSVLHYLSNVAERRYSDKVAMIHNF